MTAPHRTAGRRRPRIRWGIVALVLGAGLFGAMWGPVVAGRRVLLGGDILYQYNPWATNVGAREPRNTYVGDPVTQFLPWAGLVRESLRKGELPLWNPYSFSGTPLLANDQSSPFSPFTLLAVLFDPKHGLSLAMLAKLVAGGLGAAVFVRLHGARAPAAALAGIAYAGSSFMVVWLAYPHTGVAAVMPWAFAAVAWYFRDRRPLALAAVTVAVAMQFLAGHAETSLHLGAGLGVYVVARLIGTPERRGRAAVAVLAAAAAGTLAAGIQVLPFVDNLSRASITSDRAGSGTGRAHLGLKALGTWVAPNSKGSPGIDGSASRNPVYPESVGYAGAGALVLALYAGAVAVRRRRAQTLAIVAVGAVAAGIVYGPLSPLAARVPLLDVANNIRMLAVLCFVVAVLAGLGLDHALETRSGRSPAPGTNAVLGAGMLAVTGVVASGVVVAVEGHRVVDLLPRFGGHLGFWLLVGALAAAGGLLLLVGARMGSRLAGPGILVLAVAEFVLFAFPYNPRVPASEAPPPDSTIDWLRNNARDGGFAALGLDLIPDLSVSVGLYDSRGVDPLVDRRVRTYWSAADPGFDDSFGYTILRRPGIGWLAAAGITHILTPADKVIAGTVPELTTPSFVVARVPTARPFAFAAPSTVAAPDAGTAAAAMASDPLGAVVVEPGGSSPGAGPAAAGAAVQVTGRSNQSVTLRVVTPSPTTVVILQSYAPGWVARVDGRTTPIAPADVLFQSIVVPGGAHTVSVRYEPASVRLGLLASTIGVITIVALLAVDLSRSHRVRARLARRSPVHEPAPAAAPALPHP